MGEDLLVEQHKRAELQLKLDDLIHENVTTIFLVWEGTSDSACKSAKFLYAALVVSYELHHHSGFAN